MRVLNWNVGRTVPKSEDEKAYKVLKHLDQYDNPDVICLTEAHSCLLKGRGGYIISTSEANCSDCKEQISKKCKIKGCKVVLWSKTPWSKIDELGGDSMFSKRFVSGVIQISSEELVVIGVCIPHKGSRKSKRKDWQDHLEFLNKLKPVIEKKLKKYDKLIIMGDFNQCIGAKYADEDCQKILEDILKPLEKPTTAPGFNLEGCPSIDHICLQGLKVSKPVQPIENSQSNRIGATDSCRHFGVDATLVSK